MEQDDQEPSRWVPPPDFREQFARRCNIFLDSLSGAAQSFGSMRCHAIDESFVFGWQLEQGSSEHPWKQQGDLAFALSYLEHMIGQGLHVAFAVSQKNAGLVYLKAWEDEEQPWPQDSQIVLFATWNPMSVDLTE